MSFFYYQRTMTGQWSPRTSAEKPSTKLPEGIQVNITQIQELPENQRELSISELESRYPLNQGT